MPPCVSILSLLLACLHKPYGVALPLSQMVTKWLQNGYVLLNLATEEQLWRSGQDSTNINIIPNTSEFSLLVVHTYPYLTVIDKSKSRKASVTVGGEDSHGYILESGGNTGGNIYSRLDEEHIAMSHIHIPTPSSTGEIIFICNHKLHEHRSQLCRMLMDAIADEQIMPWALKRYC